MLPGHRLGWVGTAEGPGHTGGTSAGSLHGVLKREGEGPLLRPLGRQRDRTAVVCGRGDIGSPPDPQSQTTYHAAVYPQFGYPHLNQAATAGSHTRHHSCQGGGGVASLASGGHVRGVTRQSGARHVTTWKNTKGEGVRPGREGSASAHTRVLCGKEVLSADTWEQS